ncbi:hypothetical protein ACFQ1M_12000 [Sungkyunkwania multivorans]|uniref:HTH araC/xylS-type domain-containing protein n=1 Tax=Sungkyunkwania multivorans TaxID=1173618 RepID=A0ABW3CYZ0_9FLAO
MKRIFLFLVLIALNTSWGYGIIQLDSLGQYSFEQLEQKINANKEKNEIELANVYALAYINKARNTGKDGLLVKGYYFIVDIDSKVQKVGTKETSILYSDSIIALSKAKDHGFFTAYAYYIRGKESYKERHFKKALNDLIIADKIISDKDSLEVKYWIKQAMGILKHRTGDNDGALREMYTSLAYYKKQKKWSSYGLTAFSLSQVYIKKRELDSAKYHIDTAKEYLKGTDHFISNHLHMGSGMLEYYKANYGNAIKIFEEANSGMKRIKDLSNQAFCEYFLGESKLKLGDTAIAVNHFKRVDTIYHEQHYINPELRGAYTSLIAYYRKKKQYEKELYYVKNLLKIDSLTKDYSSYLQSNIIKEYDVPKLLERKEKLINIYKSNEKKWSIAIVILSVFMVLLAFTFFRHRRNEFKKNEKYEQIIAEFTKEKNNDPPKQVRSSKIPEKDVEKIKAAFESYEEKRTYAKSTFNKDFIRKDTGINDHYITDYLREYIGSSLTTYINDKRIALSVKKIIEDKNYRKYTMQAMAEAVGYNNESTYKRAFRERIGMRPLEFIDKRKKEEGSNS